MDLIAPTALLTDTLNRCRREKCTEVFDALDYLESPQNGLSINFAGALDSDS
jgi:hypothetical protein